MKFPKSIEIGEHIYIFPSRPDPDEVLFIDCPKREQYWRRITDFPQYFYDYNPYTKTNAAETEYDDTGKLISLSVKDTSEIIRLRERELKRRSQGVWFMNNGEPTYLTGDHYFCLQWFAMFDCVNPLDKSHFGTYREFQAHFFYFLDLCTKNENCKGGFIVKPKKTGITLLIAGRFLNRSTMFMQKRFGFMSKSFLDCRDVNFKYYIYGLDNLPFIFKPKVGKNTLTTILFANPRQRVSGTKSSVLAQLENSKGFNTDVVASPTTVAAFDGAKMFEVQFDEFPKYKDPRPDAVWQANKESVKMQEEILGLIWLTSYAPEKDDASFKESKKIYYDSGLNTISEVTKRTITELFKYFISSLNSFEEYFKIKHEDWEILGKYGKVNPDKIRHTIMNRRRQLERNRNELQSYIRQYPITETEVWRQGGAEGSTFDNIRLGRREDEIKQALHEGDRPYVEGRLAWTDGRTLKDRYNPGTRKYEWAEVQFIPLTEQEKIEGKEGKFRMYRPEWINPEYYNVPFRKSLRDFYGNLTPSVDTIFTGASDPTEYVLKSDVAVGSKNAITVKMCGDVRTNTLTGGKNVTDRMVATYLYRPEDPDEYLEDLVMTILYFGMYTLVEANKAWVIKKLKEMGLHNFILFRNKEKAIVPYREGDYQTLITTVQAGGTYVIEDICREIQLHLRAPGDNEPDNLQLYEDERLISQLMEFDPMNTKRYDFVMCWGLNLLAEIGLNAHRYKLREQSNKREGNILQTVFNALV